MVRVTDFGEKHALQLTWLLRLALLGAGTLFGVLIRYSDADTLANADTWIPSHAHALYPSRTAV